MGWLGLFEEDDEEEEGIAAALGTGAAGRDCTGVADEVVLAETFTPGATLGIISTDAWRGVTTSGNILAEDWLTPG